MWFDFCSGVSNCSQQTNGRVIKNAHNGWIEIYFSDNSEMMTDIDVLFVCVCVWILMVGKGD